MEYELDERGALQINLGTIQENLDPAVYPETDAYISAWFDAPDSTLDLFEISDIFLSCDKTQPLAPEIAEFVLPNYEYRAEKGDSDAMVTLGGLVTDKYQNVLDDNCYPIPGLYAIGNTCGQRFGIQYSTPTAGNCCGHAMTNGYVAPEHVVAYLERKS